MGFDLNGLNPIINIKYSEEYNDIMNKYGKDGWLDWSMDIPDETKNKYFELKDQFQEENPGEYFRNNVWFWRPLWSFVCDNCSDFLTEKDMDKGNYNDCAKISKTKAVKIAKRLSKLIADGTVNELHRINALMRAQAKIHNDEVKAEMARITKECQDKHGKDLVPANFPKPYKSQWEKAYAKENWSASYPFDEDNIKDFAIFCQQSGGFKIC